MATDDAEHVAEPSNGSSHVMQMTSQLPLCVQQLNCDDIDDVNDSNESDDYVGVRLDNNLAVTHHSTMTSTDVFTSAVVLLSLLFLFSLSLGIEWQIVEQFLKEIII